MEVASTETPKIEWKSAVEKKYLALFETSSNFGERSICEVTFSF